MKLLEKMEKFEEHIIGIGLIVASAILFANVVLRYVFNNSSSWMEEFIRYVMIWITFIGAAVCFRKNAHVGIDAILSVVPPSVKKVIRIFVLLMSLLFMWYLLRYGLELVLFSVKTGQITPSMQIKLFWIYIAIPLGAFLSIIDIIRLFPKILRDEE